MGISEDSVENMDWYHEASDSLVDQRLSCEPFLTDRFKL